MKIDFIVFYKNSSCINKCVNCIEALRKPDGVEIDILGISEGDSICEAYDAAMAESDADLKIYVRENVYIINQDFLENVITFMDSHQDVGMAGVIGGFENGKFVDWTTGAANIVNDDRATLLNVASEGSAVDFLQGSVLVTRCDVPWVCDGQDSDRLFDINHSKAVREKGMSLAVFAQKEPWIVWEYGVCFNERLDVFTEENIGWTYVNQDFPLVSVIIPCHNSEKFVEDTIISVLNQTYQNLQVILVDDASTDSTAEILQKYADKDSRVETIFLNKNSHVCYASNIARKQAKGKYIAMIGHDDLWRPGKIEEQVSFMERRDDIVVCFTSCHVIGDNLEFKDKAALQYHLFRGENRTQKEWFLKLYIGGNCLCAPSAVIRASEIPDNMYQLGFVQVQDYYLWLQLLEKGNFYILKEDLTLYRQFDKLGVNISNIDAEGESPVLVRTLHEASAMKYRLIMEMTDEEFAHFFNPEFRNSASSSREELKCERAFLLLKCKSYYFMDAFYDIFEDEKATDVLLNKFGFSLLDFYELEKTHWL